MLTLRGFGLGASVLMLASGVGVAADCWLNALSDCCSASGALNSPVPCGSPPKPCQNARITEADIAMTVGAKEGETGMTAVIPNGSMECEYQRKVCDEGICRNNGGYSYATCYSDILNPNSANCDGGQPD